MFSLHFFIILAQQPPSGPGGLLIHDVSRSHTTTHHSRSDSSGRVISSSQRPLPDNTQHSQQTDIHVPVGFDPTISAGARQQTYALDSAATATGPLQFSTFLWVFLDWVLMVMLMMIYVKHVKMQEIFLLRAMAYTNFKSVPSNRLRLQQNIFGRRIHTLQTGVNKVVKKCGRHLTILGARRATLSINHNDDPLILGATIIMK